METNGQWTLSQHLPPGAVNAAGKKQEGDADVVIAHGTVSFAANRWQKIGLSFKGDQVSARVNGIDVGSARTDCGSGMMGIGCGWHAAQFDNITIR